MAGGWGFGAVTGPRADRATAGATPTSAPTTGGLPATEIVDASDWPAARWDELAVRSPGGHAFQSHAWGEHKAEGGWRIRRLAIRAAGAQDAWLGVVSLQERQIGRWSVLYAPRGPILLGDAERSAPAVLRALADLARRRRALALTVDPLWEDGGPLAGALAAAGFRPSPRPIQVSRTAMLVPLARDEREQHRLLRKSTANLVNRARRAGVTVEQVGPGGTPGAAADDDPLAAALERMWELLAATARREGIVLRARAYQIAQWRSLVSAGHAWCWFAGLEGRRDVGAVVLRCGDRLHLYQAGSADEARLAETNANHLLQWSILRWAAEAGFRAYDLGGVDTPRAPGIPGGPEHPLWNLYLFKRGFGAEPVCFVPAHEVSSRPWLGALWRLARRLR